jgi:hypothetical protein
MSHPGARGIFAAVVVLMILASGCRSTRSTFKAPLKEEGPEYLYSRLEENEFRFNTFSAKYAASFSQDRNSSDFTGQLRVIRDSAIWVSISPALGIEMIRLLVTSDSVKYINRIEKSYFVGDYALLWKFLETNVDFDILQALVMGNDFQFYENASFRATVDGREYRLSTSGRRKIKKEAESTDHYPLILVQNIWLDPASFKIMKVDLKEYQKENRNLAVNYQGFTDLDGQLVPGKVRIDIMAGGHMVMDVNYNKPALDPSITLPFTIPQNYRRIY